MKNNVLFYAKRSAAIIFIIILVGYSYYQTRNFRRGPEIIITSPTNGETVARSFIEITGQALRIATITLNDRPIFIDEAGNFKEKRLLLYGYNTITIKAADKFGRQTEKTLQLVYR